MAPVTLVLEMTEGIFVQDSDRAMSVISELKNLGIRLALDDIGTGSSSLSYLRRVTADIVKVDQSIVADVGRDPSASTTAAAVDRALPTSSASRSRSRALSRPCSATRSSARGASSPRASSPTR